MLTNHLSKGDPVGPEGLAGDSGCLRTVFAKTDFWTDNETGQLVQVVTEAVELDQRKEYMWRWITTFSGIGEPNEITVPTLADE